jgi:hypothetical protein
VNPSDTIERAGEHGGQGDSRDRTYKRDAKGTSTGGQFTASSGQPTASPLANSGTYAPRPKKGGGAKEAPKAPSSSKFKTLGPNEDNDPQAIAEMQQLLTALGLGNLTSGQYDKDTENAVSEAQKRLGIKPTGKANKALVTKMLNAYDLSPCIKRSEDSDEDDIERFDISQLRDLRGRWARFRGRGDSKSVTPESTPLKRLPNGLPRPRGERRHAEVRSELSKAQSDAAIGKAASTEARRITGRDIPFDFTGSDAALAREHAEGVLRGLEAFPTARLDRVSMADGLLGGRPAFAWVETHATGGHHGEAYHEGYEIVFSRDWAAPGSADRYREALRAASRRTPRMGRGNVGGTAVDVGVHEFGHVVAHSGMADHRAGELAHDFAHAHIEHDEDPNVRRSRRRMFLGNEVSLYAVENDNELSAEAFADVMLHGDEASELSRHIYDLFEDRIAEVDAHD